MFLIAGAVAAPRRAAMLPFIEPDLVGGGVHAVKVPNAAMCDQAFEAVGAHGEPVHHVTTKRGPGGAHALAVDVGQLLQVIGTLHQVVVALAAPIAGNLIDVLLTKP